MFFVDNPEGVMNRFEISGRILARNWLLNMAGQALPFAIGLISVPVILHGLGTERFGLLALSWTLLGAFGVFDLGFGRALTKFAAEALGRANFAVIPGLVWTAVLAQVGFGTIGGVVLATVASPLVKHFLNVSPSLHQEAIRTFQLVGVSLPVVLVSFMFQGALEAAQRFDVITGIRTVSSSSTFLVPLAGTLLGWDLPGILVALLAVRLVVLGLFLYACIRVLSITSAPIRVTRENLRPMLTFGGWIAVSGLMGLILTPADRLVIGHSISMTALTYYTVPQELISRLSVLSAGLATVLFPAFAALGGARDLSRLRLLFGRSSKYVALTAVPAFGLMGILAPDILGIWLGPTLAAQSAPMLRIFAVGAGLQVLAVAPYTLLQGLGRADVTAKIHFGQMPFYLGALWWSVRHYGIVGAAFVWSGRIVLESVLLYWAAGRIGAWTWRGVWATGRRVIAPVAAVWALPALISLLSLSLVERATLVAGVVAGFAWWVWVGVLDSEERSWVVSLVSVRRREPAGQR